jgi:hypothetical protein
MEQSHERATFNRLRLRFKPATFHTESQTRYLCANQFGQRALITVRRM